MNIINGIAMGVSALLGYMGFPVSSAYTNIKVYGQNIVDYVHIKNVEMTEAEMLATPLYIDPTWDGNTIFLALFQNNLNGGNITGLVNPILNWEVQRKKESETVYKTIAILPSTATGYIDLTVEPNVVYNYQIFATNDTEVSEPLANNLDSKFYNHIIIDTETGTAIVFDNNLEFSGYTQEVSYETYVGYNKFPAFSFGNRRYRTANASAYVGECIEVDNEFIQTVDYLNTIDNLINKTSDKIMKDRKGFVLRGKTVGGITETPMNVAIPDQPYIVSFNFVESGEVDG